MRVIFCLVLLTGIGLGAGPAAARDLSLDNVIAKNDKITIVYKHILFKNTNLSADEATTLLTTTDPRQRESLYLKLKADSVSAPEIDLTTKGGVFVFQDFRAKDVDSGKARLITLRGGHGTVDGRLVGSVDIGSIEAANLTWPHGQSENASQPIGQSFVWNGFRAKLSDKAASADGSGGTWLISLGSIEGKGPSKTAQKLVSSAALKDLIIDPPPGSKAGKVLEAIGYRQLDLNFDLSGVYDESKRTYSFSQAKLSGAGMGSIDFAALLGSIDESFLSAPQPDKIKILDRGTLQSLRLDLLDRGLFDKTLAWFASQKGTTLKQMRMQWAAAATLTIPLFLKGAPGASNLAEAISDFINKPNKLAILLKAKGKGVNLGELRVGAINEKDFLSEFDLTATAAP